MGDGKQIIVAYADDIDDYLTKAKHEHLRALLNAVADAVRADPTALVQIAITRINTSPALLATLSVHTVTELHVVGGPTDGD